MSGGQGFSLSNGVTFQNICARLAAVKLVAKVSLKTTPEQADALIRTMQTTNAACDWLSDVA